MGQELKGQKNKSKRVLQVEACGTISIAEIDVVRNGRDIYIYKGDNIHKKFQWVDKEDFKSVCLYGYDEMPFIYYYVRVVQEDGELAWSSPIWIS